MEKEDLEFKITDKTLREFFGEVAINMWLERFEKTTKKLPEQHFNGTAYFNDALNYLANFKNWQELITPKQITKFYEKVEKRERILPELFLSREKGALGIFLSALMQTSYYAGHREFRFEEVNADGFGSFLKGQPKNVPIKIEAKTIKGDWSLYWAENCTLTTETLEGNFSLENAKDCFAQITNYKGEYFGFGMKNCAIESGNKETLERIKKTTNKIQINQQV